MATKKNTFVPPWSQYTDAAIKDLRNKYGFNYNPEFANRQAALERQSKQLALQQQRAAVDRDVQSADRSLSQNYFMRYMNQAQNQTNQGINAGMAADQNLRLQMSRMAEMADVYNKAFDTKRQIDQQLAMLPQEEKVRAEQLRNERLQQLFENAMELQRLGMDESARQEELKLGWARLQEEKRQFNSELEWRKYMYKNMSAAERAQLEWAKRQFGEEMAWRRYELSRAQQLTREGWAFTGGLYQGMLGN